MATRLVSVVFDAQDHAAQGRWWADALGWRIVFETDDEVEVSSGIDGVPTLTFGTVPEPKTVKNRIHLDLVSEDDAHMRATVDRLLATGATYADVGQGDDVPWVVLADPEGNELCVLEPRERTRGAPGLASIVVDARDPAALGRFWAEAAGWPVANERPGVFTSLHRPGDRPPDLDFVPVADPKLVKHRVHLDVAPEVGDDRAAVIAHLHALGAVDADVGQGPDVTWHVLADPEGGEFCVLSNR
jgi:hypothetical protein